MSETSQDGLTMDCGWRGHCEVPQSILKARVRVIRWCRWRRRGYEVGERDPLGEGVQTHGVKVASSQGLGVVGAGVEGLGQLVQGAVEGGFKDTGSTHARGQAEAVDDLLWAGVWGPLTPERGGQRCSVLTGLVIVTKTCHFYRLWSQCLVLLNPWLHEVQTIFKDLIYS